MLSTKLSDVFRTAPETLTIREQVVSAVIAASGAAVAGAAIVGAAYAGFITLVLP
jgi:hypothetical protein